jgi:hypothetical protein
VLGSFVIYIYAVRPLESFIEHRKTITSESMMTLFVLLTLLMASSQETRANDYEQLMLIGWINISLFMCALLI